MNPSFYLLSYSAIVIILVVMFVRGSRRRQPSRLRLGPRELASSETNTALSTDGISQIDSRGFLPRSKNASGRPRQLNIFFNYNGETFDAYEILGLPAGCSLDAARDHYGRIFSIKPENERRLYDAALSALEKSTQKPAS